MNYHGTDYVGTGYRPSVEEYVQDSDDLFYMEGWLENVLCGEIEGVKYFANLVRLAGDALDLDAEFVWFNGYGIPHSWHREDVEQAILNEYL